jgi:geranylgeranyl pyrophosphate synthase
LRELARQAELSAESLRQARSIVVNAGGIDYTERYLQDLCTQALALLDGQPDNPHVEALRTLVTMVAQG